MTTIYLLFFTSTLSMILGYIYVYLWNRSSLKKNVPTGYGFLLILFFIVFSFFTNDNIYLYLLILFLASIYWIDDLLSLSATIRFTIQFLSGVLIGSFIIFNQISEINTFTLTLIIFSGLLNIFLTNVINFYDGLDLNLSTLILIFVFICILFLSDNKELYSSAIILMGFILGFSIYNYKPNFLYFGDSGCFVLASLITYYIIGSLAQLSFDFIYLLMVFSLPILDVSYVLALRVILKENLLSRNYLHLYHRVFFITNNKMYLINQIFNTSLIILVYYIFVYFNFDSIFAVILSSLIVTPIFYFTFRQVFFVKKTQNG